MGTQTPQSGVSLIELLVGVLIAGIVLFATMSLLPRSMKSISFFSKSSSAETSMIGLYTHISKVGRLAMDCKLVNNTCPYDPKADFQCNVDFNVPPTGSVTPVRFLATTDQDQDGNTIPVVHYFFNGAVTPTLTYQNISAFMFCDYQQIKDGCCPLPSATKNQHVDDVESGATPASRYFVFFLASEPLTTPGQFGHVSTLQGSIWGRNSGAPPIYQWGSQ